MYLNMKYYENICNCLRVIQQDINRKLKSANCWQRTSLKTSFFYRKHILLLNKEFQREKKITKSLVFRQKQKALQGIIIIIIIIIIMIIMIIKIIIIV